MKLLADIHTHSIASGHAYSTINENIQEAAKKGLTLLALTDHAPVMQGTTNHAYFMNLRVVPESLYGVRILRGVELNILDHNGTVDLDDAALSRLDIALASLHTPCVPPASRKENTRAYLKVMENPMVDIIGHPGDPRYDVDYDQVFAYARETKTILEINNASLTPNSFRAGSDVNIKKLLRLSMKEGVPVVLGSDAHFYTSIGVFSHVEALLNDMDFPPELVLNTDPDRLVSLLKHTTRKK